MNQEVRVKPSKFAAYEDLFERMLTPTLLLDISLFTILDANYAAESALERQAEDLVGCPILDWVESSAEQEFLKMLRVARRRYYPTNFETKLKRKDGGSRIVNIVACSLKLSDGNEVLQLIANDITKEKENEIRAAKYLQELQELNKRLEELSTTDEMTGLLNFRSFRNSLYQEHARASRYKSCYALVFIDVDYFKKYNDTKGHAAGDQVLKHVASIIRSTCRNTDLVARYGGEEFVVICTESDAKSSYHLAERIRTNVETFKYPEDILLADRKITISLGIAGYPADAQDPDDLIRGADKALYYSKNTGRNRVTLYSEL